MKKSIQAIGSLLLGTILTAVLVSVPAMAADVQDVHFFENFDQIELNTSPTSLRESGLVDTLYSGDLVLADPDPAAPENHVYQMDGSGKKTSLDTNAQYATTDFSFRVYLPDSTGKEISFTAFCNWRDDVNNTTGSDLQFSSISGLSGAFVAQDNKINGAAYTPNSWHTIRYVSESAQDGYRIYKYFDNKLVACVKDPARWDITSRKAIGLNNVQLHGKSLHPDLRYDDISLTMLTNQPQVTLNIEGEYASGDYNVKDIVTSAITAKATVTDCTTATAVVFKDGSGSALGTVALNENGEASIGILPGQTVYAEAVAEGVSGTLYTMATSEAKTAKGLAFSQQYYFYNSYDGTTADKFYNDTIYEDYYGNDGVKETNWTKYSYHASLPGRNEMTRVVNKDGMLMHNRDVHDVLTATGVNLPEDTNGHTIAVKMTSVQTETGGLNPKFMPWIGYGIKPQGGAKAENRDETHAGWNKFYGMSPAEYQAAGGTADNYAEKMKPVYVVAEQYYRFDDFAVGRNLLKPNWFTTTNEHSWYVRYGGIMVGESDGDSAALRDCNGNELATVQTNQWYRLTCVYDIKNGVYSIFVDGEYKGECDFTRGGELKNPICMSEIIEWYDGVKTTDNKTSAMYMDDFKIFMTSFENEIADPTADGSITLKNDGTSKHINIITAAYTDAACTKLVDAVIDTVTFDAGDLQKTVQLSLGNLPNSAAQKTFFIDVKDAAMKPLRAAYVK